MRKLEASLRKPADKIVLRAERGIAPRKSASSPRKLRRTTKAASTLGKPAGQATMDYQMGFTSGPSN